MFMLMHMYNVIAYCIVLYQQSILAIALNLSILVMSFTAKTTVCTYIQYVTYIVNVFLYSKKDLILRYLLDANKTNLANAFQIWKLNAYHFYVYSIGLLMIKR